MRKILSLDTEIKSIDSEEEDVLKIAGYASTISKDRAADVIAAEAWTRGGLKNFKKNPILLFNHDYDRPIGKIIEVEADSNGLKIKAVVSKSAGAPYDLIKEGILSTFSVGFLIKDADYDRETDGLVIKSAELLEVSVVSVPCNQDATFSVAKSFSTQEEYQEFKQQFVASDDEDRTKGPLGEVPGKIKKMDETDISSLIEKALAKNDEARIAREVEASKAAQAQADLDEKIANAVAKASVSIMSSSEERIAAELTKRFADESTTLTEKLAGMQEELAAKGEEINNLLTSKRVFADRNSGDTSWKKEFAKDIDDAYLLGRVTNKGYDTDFAKDLVQKVNAHSSVSVSSADFEQEVSTNIERDIQNELILAPLFREVNLTTATQILPIMPDTGYAEITASAGSTNGTSPNGTLDTRGGSDRAGVPLTEVVLQTVKMVAKSYLGNETEEDAIMPVLPLIREAMIRQHARGVENLILLGGHADGAYSGLTTASGLLKYASTNSRDIATGTVGTLPALTAAGLLTLRKNMGKYGVRAADVSYIVSQTAYFDLLEDPEFQDFNLVNNQATKLTGQVGQIFGSSVLLCDEFPTAAATKYYALAVNTRNFVMPRLRGVTVESDYSVENQHRVLVTSQRLGFTEIIPNAKSVYGFKYPAGS